MKYFSLLHIYIILFSILVSSCQMKGTSSNADDTDSVKVQSAEQSKVYSATETYEMASKSIAMIICYDQNHIPLSQGSGFFIAEDTLLTNFHVVAGGYSVEYKIIGEEKIYKSGKVVLVSDEYDLAKVVTKSKHQPLSLAKDKSISVGEHVFAIGNPRGLEGTLSEGIVSGLRTDDVDLIQTTAPISPGSSGGPLLNQRGEVIGVSTFTFKDSQNINFAVPVSHAKDCLTEYEPTVRSSHIEVINNKNLLINNLSISPYSSSNICVNLSIQNKTGETINKICGLIISYNDDGTMMDYGKLEIKEEIYDGFTKRISTWSRNIGIGEAYKTSIKYHQMDTSNFFKSRGYPMIEIRILYYETED